MEVPGRQRDPRAARPDRPRPPVRDRIAERELPELREARVLDERAPEGAPERVIGQDDRVDAGALVVPETALENLALSAGLVLGDMLAQLEVRQREQPKPLPQRHAGLKRPFGRRRGLSDVHPRRRRTAVGGEAERRSALAVVA